MIFSFGLERNDAYGQSKCIPLFMIFELRCDNRMGLRCAPNSFLFLVQNVNAWALQSLYILQEILIIPNIGNQKWTTFTLQSEGWSFKT